jgi:hypothetical protein
MAGRRPAMQREHWGESLGLKTKVKDYSLGFVWKHIDLISRMAQ